MRSTAYRSRKAGFTILEAMVVVAIIAISAALAAPALSEAMAQRRAGEATHELVRIGALARSESIAYGRAHLLQYSSGGDGRVELWRGRINQCAAEQWGMITTGSCNTNPDCVAALDMAAYDHGTHRVRMRLDGAGSANICFQPDGEMRFQMSGGWTSTPPSGSQGVRFEFDRLENGGAAGVQRVVVFPFGATPRILR